MQSKNRVAVSCFLGVCMVTGTQGAYAQGAQPVFGEPMPLGNGTVRSFVRAGEDGKPETLGVSFSKSALSGLPEGENPTEVVLKLPLGVEISPIDHIAVDWNSHGHEPQGVYDVPHFDVHFYFMPVAERMKIPADAQEQFAKAPLQGALPPDYHATPGGVSQMGAHWVDVTSPEFNGVPFTATFIYGSYDGVVTFCEPMLAKSFMEKKQPFTAEVKQPAVFGKEGYYPKSYNVTYDNDAQAYLVSLDGLGYHKQQ